MELEKQLKNHFGLDHAVCQHLNTPTNDVIAVTTPTGKFALKLYNIASRPIAEVQWELQLIAHLVQHGAPVVKPVASRHGYAETFTADGKDRATALFEWAAGEKPKPGRGTYVLLGKAAAYIHNAADTFTSPPSPDRTYDAAKLIDDQLARMKPLLVAAERWQQMVDLGDRLKGIVADPALDWGICHTDLTLDNVHQSGDTLTVFDFDSAGVCWRALEAHGISKTSSAYFAAWLEGYRSVRPFSLENEKAVAAFGIIGDLRVVAWKLGVATSSRGKPLLGISGLKDVVDEWLRWERQHVLPFTPSQTQ